MHRSSTSSSETLVARPWLPRTLLALAVWLLAAEGVLRIPAVQAALPDPEPTLWHAPLVEAKIRNLKSVEENSDIDVLFIGNSSVQSGIDPTVFDQTRCAQSSTRCTSYNGSIEGLPPYGVRLFLEIYLRYSQPHTVVYGLLAQDLNSGSPWAKDVTDRVKNSVMAQAEAQRSWTGKLLAVALDASRLFRYRFVLHRMLLGAAKADDDVYFDDRGFHPIPAESSGPAAAARYGKHPGLINYSLDGPQAQEVAKIVELCNRRGIRLILADMPVTAEYGRYLQDPEDYSRYASRVESIASAGRVPLWDAEDLAPAGLEGEDFSDTSHLNVVGARKLSAQLATLFQDSVASQDAAAPQSKVASLDGSQ